MGLSVSLTSVKSGKTSQNGILPFYLLFFSKTCIAANPVISILDVRERAFLGKQCGCAPLNGSDRFCLVTRDN